MALRMRSFTWKKDFELVRAFLILSYSPTHSFQNWIPSRFENINSDPVSRIAELEPVGTHPDYRNLGLARSVICEGLRRLRKYSPSVILRVRRVYSKDGCAPLAEKALKLRFKKMAKSP